MYIYTLRRPKLCTVVNTNELNFIHGHNWDKPCNYKFVIAGDFVDGSSDSEQYISSLYFTDTVMEEEFDEEEIEQEITGQGEAR